MNQFRYQCLSRHEVSQDSHLRRSILDLAESCIQLEANISLGWRLESLVGELAPADAIAFVILAMNERQSILAVAAIPEFGTGASSCHLFVDPRYRRHGIGTELLRRAYEVLNTDAIRLWNHNDVESGQQFAVAHKFPPLQSLTFFGLRPSTAVSETMTSTPIGRDVTTVPIGEIGDSWKEVLQSAYGTGSFVNDLESREWLRDAWAVVVVESGRINPIGVLVIRRVNAGGLDALENHAMAVMPDYQGLGVAKTLLHGLAHYARKIEIDFIISYVDSGNVAAMASHKATGFTPLSVSTVYLAARQDLSL